MKDKRLKNERKFGNWEDSLDGGRKYWLDVIGKKGGTARYVKEVDINENTTKFYQEVFDDSGKLIEIHEKYPVDKGHVKIL